MKNISVNLVLKILSVLLFVSSLLMQGCGRRETEKRTITKVVTIEQMLLEETYWVNSFGGVTYEMTLCSNGSYVSRVTEVKPRGEKTSELNQGGYKLVGKEILFYPAASGHMIATTEGFVSTQNGRLAIKLEDQNYLILHRRSLETRELPYRDVCSLVQSRGNR